MPLIQDRTNEPWCPIANLQRALRNGGPSGMGVVAGQTQRPQAGLVETAAVAEYRIPKETVGGILDIDADRVAAAARPAQPGAGCSGQRGSFNAQQSAGKVH